MRFKLSVSLFFFSLLFLANTVKGFLIVPFLVGMILFFLSSKVRFDLIKVIFILLMLSLPVERGIRGFDIMVVESLPMVNLPGYQFYFGISLKLIFGLLLLLLILKERWIDKEKWLEKLNSVEMISLFIFLGLTIVSVFLSNNWLIGIYGLVRIFFGVWLFLLGRKYLRNLELFSWFKWIVVGVLMFEGIISGLQWLKGGVLGRHIETTARVVPFGRVTYESDLLYRTVGTTGHPTFLASLLTMLIPVAFGFWFQKLISKKQLGFNWENLLIGVSLLLGILGVITSFSRSSWLAVALMIGIMSWLGFKKLNWKLLIRKSWWLMSIGVGVIIWLSAEIILRLSSFRSIFSLGTGKDRWLLIKEAVEMIKAYPVWGIGLNNFTAALAQSDLTGLSKRLLFPVHNTFVLLMSELGLLPMLFFIFFVGWMLVKTARTSFKNIFLFGVWFGCLSYVFNSQFHALFSQDASFDYFMLMLGLLASRSKL